MKIYGCAFYKDLFGSCGNSTEDNSTEDTKILFLVNDGDFEDWQTIEEIADCSHSIKEILAAIAEYWKEYKSEEDFIQIQINAEREFYMSQEEAYFKHN